MIKYLSCKVVFAEIPNMVSLAINITNCQNNCLGCHSPELRTNSGNELTNSVIDELIEKNKGIDCIVFMGEGRDKNALISITEYIKSKQLKVGVYSGSDTIQDEYVNVFDFIKIGRYDHKLGPINKKTTNQRLYEVVNTELVDITGMMQKNS